MKPSLGLLAAVAAAFLPSASAPAATCSGYSNQAAAQRAADTRDADGDGRYCESLPCPCSTAPPGSGGGDAPGEEPRRSQPSCSTPSGVQRLVFSAGRYPNIRAHHLAAVRRGWPRVMVLNRQGADARRDRLLDGY